MKLKILALTTLMMKFKLLKILAFTLFILCFNKGFSQDLSIITTDSLTTKYNDFKYDYEDYNNHLKKKPEYKKYDESSNYNYSYNENVITTFKFIGIFLILVIVGVIAYFFLKDKGILFNSQSKKVLTEEYINENILKIDLNDLLQQAIKENHKELIIRYQFLIFLKKLSNNNYIDWNPEKTNTDYFYEIKNQSLKSDFEYASYLYTYIWYGKFDITEDVFNKAHNHFNVIINKY